MWGWSQDGHGYAHSDWCFRRSEPFGDRYAYGSIIKASFQNKPGSSDEVPGFFVFTSYRSYGLSKSANLNYLASVGQALRV